MILKSISIIKAPKILPKIKDFEVFVARWDMQCNTKIKESRKLFDEINSKKLDFIF